MLTLIETQRLRIRPFTLEEAPFIAATRSDPVVARFLPWEPPFPLEEAKLRIETAGMRTALEPNQWVLRAVERLEGGTLVGEVGVRGHHEDPQQAIIGYVFAHAAHGHGYATEVVRAVVRELFLTHRLHRVFAYTQDQNRASQRVLEKIGFRREAHMIEAFFARGQWQSEYMYAMLAREWGG
jgi:RimJ/RimL family protein N-acetyltransferase